MFPFPSFYFYTYLTLVKGLEKNQWQPISTFNSCILFTFFPSFGFSFSLYLFFPCSTHPCPWHVRKQGKEKKEKKKDQKAFLLAGNNQEISKHSWFAIGLNERTAFLNFFPLFLFNCLVFLSFFLFVLVSLCLCYNYSLKRPLPKLAPCQLAI